MKTLIKIWDYLNGKKTIIGSVGLFITFGSEGLGWLPPEIAGWLKGIFGAMTGVGISHKIYKIK